MGVVIFTKDDEPYRVGDYVVMRGDMSSAPIAPDTTYIYYTNKFTEKDVIYWSALIKYRLVIVGKKPKLTKATTDIVIVDKSHDTKKGNFKRPINALFRWADRNRVWAMIRRVPIPLINSFLRENRADDITLGRLLARSRYQLPDEYLHATIAYAVQPTNDDVIWPKRKRKVYEKPSSFRESDKYIDLILHATPDAANDLRRSEPEALPKGMKKREEKDVKWI